MSHESNTAGAALPQRPSEENTLVWIADPISSTGVRGMFVNDIKCLWWWKAGLIFQKESEASALALRMRAAIASHGQAPAGVAERPIASASAKAAAHVAAQFQEVRWQCGQQASGFTAQAAPAAGAVAGPSLIMQVGTQGFDLASTSAHFTAGDMYTASAQAFREGQAAAAPAQLEQSHDT